MAAAKTGLPKYERIAGGHAFAARVSAVEPFGQVAGAMTLRFSDSPKRVNLIPEWVAANRPVAGGYFVLEDDADGNTSCRFVDATAFSAEFKRPNG